MAKDKAYQEAERKIANALRSQTRNFDLRGMGLTELPDSIGQLTQLQNLHINDNHLTALPESFGQLTQLRTLNLADNQLTAFPESLGQLTQLQSLYIYNNKLTALPESLGQLTQLQALYINNNQLTTLPESFGQLTQLRTLFINNNQLTALPKLLTKNLSVLGFGKIALGELPVSLRNLTQLKKLFIWETQLTTIPDWIGELRTLQFLDFSGNDICNIPESLAKLKQLETLVIGDTNSGGNPLERIPEWIGHLPKLSDLQLCNCRLTDLPTSLAQLKPLKELELDDNPLNPELAAAYEQGLDAVKAYLREKDKGTRQRYEAKLLILGDGNEGKTCVSTALRGLPFEDQHTTRGVEVNPWSFPHPDHPDDADREITLNIWDFEGQEINHQTHQFFLSTDSLYVLVFKCRDQFLLDQAEYWLDTIRSRAPGAQVAIVITECEERTPYIPEDRLLAEYGDLLLDGRWLFAVGCQDESGIPELQQELQRRAADLEFMGRDWPLTYDSAETQIEDKAKGKSHMTRGSLHDIFEDSKIDAEGYEEAARGLARLGIITEFPDCPDLSDFVVLQPQWLTKAISFVMENKQLVADKGEITFESMKGIWKEQNVNQMFGVFHDCMKEFELCYDLEDCKDRCMVPLRFGYLKPNIPWTKNDQFKTRRVTYKLNLRPPMGLMSRFIVKTHHMIVRPEQGAAATDGPRGVYWHNGVFLESGEGPLQSQALCEFDAELRTLSIEVRAAFPQKMLDQIDAYVGAVFSFFKGLKPERSYGCIEVDDNTQTETQCRAAHPERKILYALQKQREVSCDVGWHDVNPMQLIMGIGSFGGDIKSVVREEAERTRTHVDRSTDWAKPLIKNITTLLDWAEQHQQTLRQLQVDQAKLAPEIRQELESKLREYLGHMSDMLDERHQKSAPSVFSIGTQEGSPWNPKTYFKQTYVLTPWCEHEGGMHRHLPGQVRFPTNQEWWNKTAPWIARGTKVLATGLQLAFAGMPLAVGDDVYGAVKNEVTFMKELTKHLELGVVEGSGKTSKLLKADDLWPGEQVRNLQGEDGETSLMRAALAHFLEGIAPTQYRAGQWGELKRVRLPDNTHRWLCVQHAREGRR